jgi:transposase
VTDAQVDDLLWRTLEPLLPPRKRRPKGGHPFCDDRACLAGILFVLRTGRPWREVPSGLGASGVTCWRRLRDWQAAGVWSALHEASLAKLGRSGGLDWSRASLDSTSVRAQRGAATSAPARPTEGAAAPSST